MILNSQIERKLVEVGFDAFSVNEKNSLADLLAKREGKSYLEITSEYILNHHKNLKKYILKDACELSIIEGFTASNGHIYRTNRDDQTNMIGQKDELNDDPSIAYVDWKTEDADYIRHTREEWMTVYREAFAYKKAQLFKYNSLKKLIDQVQTHDEVVAINWDTEIPTVEETTSTTTTTEPTAEEPVQPPVE